MYSLRNKKIGIFGLSMTGISIYKYILYYTKDIVCWDDKIDNRNNFINSQKNLQYTTLLPLWDTHWQHTNTIFISPGIPHTHKIFLLAKKYNICISSDIELFLHHHNPQSKIVAVTGTNGKSTTTALIGHILQSCDYHVAVGGNIGIPVLSLPQNKSIYVLELSSFQLDLISFYNPTIAVLLNITPDHLDRYNTFNQYCQAKMRILNGNGIKIIGVTTPTSKNIYNKLVKNQNNIIAISGKRQLHSISCMGNVIRDDYYDLCSYVMPKLHNLIGQHNQENIAASYAVCRSLGLTPECIVNTLSSFQGLKHRMQNLGSKNNITYYNDSKATNSHAAASSLSLIKNILWIAGGIYKEKNLALLKPCLKNIKKAYLFGTSSLLFATYLSRDQIEFEVFDTMQHAFLKAQIEARHITEQVNIVLAPACTSFDQFNNFEERGNQFIDLCNAELY